MSAENCPTPLTIGGKKLADPSLWHQPGREVHLGCVNCPEREHCGGLSVGAPIHSCLDLCCKDPDNCTRYACPNNLARYTALVNEVGGFRLRPFTNRVAPINSLPDYIPGILDAGSILGRLHLPVVAISLYDVFDRKTGLAKFKTKSELLAAFKIDGDARLVIIGSGRDRDVEDFWGAAVPKRTAESLLRLRPALITTPNPSMHVDTVRHDNLVSMARIAALFEMFASAGLPVALHANARTPFDYRRWAEYLKASPDITTIAVEMGTMGRSSVRRHFHSQQLAELAVEVGRPLTLIVRGGNAHVTVLSQFFRQVVFVDTTANMKAKQRQGGRFVDGRVVWSQVVTAPGEPIDRILLQNVRCGRRLRMFQRPTGPVTSGSTDTTPDLAAKEMLASRAVTEMLLWPREENN